MAKYYDEWNERGDENSTKLCLVTILDGLPRVKRVHTSAYTSIELSRSFLSRQQCMFGVLRGRFERFPHIRG